MASSASSATAGVARPPPAASRPPSAASSTSSAAVQDIQSRLNQLTDRLNAQSTLNESQIIQLIDQRLQSQREEFRTALNDLHAICEVGFINMQASFDAVGSWRDEVTSTFEDIQSWAAEVEERLVQQEQKPVPVQSRTQPIPLPLALGTNSRPFPRSSSILSSTPSISNIASILPHQTPALQPISAVHRRYSRLSDASEYSLATIPEQPTTPCAGPKELAKDGEEEDGCEDGPESKLSELQAPVPLEYPSIVSVAVKSSPAAVNKKRVRISSPTMERSGRDGSNGNISATLECASEDQENRPFKRPNNMSTPAASKTLYGTERSTEERFDDVMVANETVSNPGSPTKMPLWTNQSPSWVKKLGRVSTTTVTSSCPTEEQ